jgi:GNAT superfamily N-acetyltransferase
VEVRRAVREDAPFLQGCQWEAIVSSPTLLKTYPPSHWERLEQLFWMRWDPEISPAWVGLLNGVPCGAITLKKQDPAGFRLGIGVLPDARGKGVGAKLLETAQEFVRARRTILALLVDPENEGALRLYMRQGFVPAQPEAGLLRMTWPPPRFDRARS